MRALGLVVQSSFELPLTQTEIGDATGLSNVHVNRTLQELRRLGLIASKGHTHSIYCAFRCSVSCLQSATRGRCYRFPYS